MQALQSYVKIMKPIAVANEFLQGENDCFLGHVIPIITGIKRNLQRLKIEAIMTSLVKTLMSGLDNRFATVLSDDQNHVASMLIPKFKMKY